MRIIDLRSDTVTQPTDEMRAAMAVAEVGDDVYGDDPTMNKLEAMAAEMVGKQAALFVVSGTMGNQLAIMTHTQRGDEVLTGEHNHIVVHEVGAFAVLSQVSVRTVHHDDDFIYPSDILKYKRSKDIHEPATTLLSVENALSNGTVVPLELMRENYATAKQYGIHVHFDGARLFNAAVALNCDPKELAACSDSVMFCLSKGLCAPVGSILAGDFLAAAGIISLEVMTKRLHIDHANAKYLGKILLETGMVTLDPSLIQINMVFFRFKQTDFPHDKFTEYLLKNGVKINGTDDIYRFVTHNGVSRADLDAVVALIKQFA
jgi:threonine aldolase